MSRLRQIDAECSEQIDRFGLIFHAAELPRQPADAALARTDLAQIFAPWNRDGLISWLDVAWILFWIWKPACRPFSVIPVAWNRCLVV